MKSGYIAIIGQPNVGKSTLLNRLINVKLSIVSKKPQTTRHRVLGILTENDCQCYFLDTPGIVDPQYELQKLMVAQTLKACNDADVILWMIDPFYTPSDFPDECRDYFNKKCVLCIINKVDLVQRPEILPLINRLKSLSMKEIVPISAKTGEGVQELKGLIKSYLPEGPFLFPEEHLSDSPERFFVAEMIREKVFECFKKEIPYSTCVFIDEFKERAKGKDYIRAIIYVERKSQKKILIGKNGDALKHIGEAARKDIEAFLGKKIYLELWVKVKEKWRKNKAFLKELGYS
jgi:GTP-binding protein Era